MAYKLGFLLSLFFLVEMMAFAGDLCSLQVLHSLLDACAITAGKKIAIEGSITPEIVIFVESEAKATILQVTKGNPQIGEILEFELSRSYDPLILQGSEMTIKVVRSTVIGYLD
jgi:hypothetical protein